MTILQRFWRFLGFSSSEAFADKQMPTESGTPLVLPEMGRASVPKYDELNNAQLDFNRVYYKLLERIADTNPHVSYALTNFAMANVPHTIYFPDRLSPRKQKQLLEHLNKKRDAWFMGGFNSFDSTLTRELMVKGAISIEAVLDRTLSGVSFIDDVQIEDIYFYKDSNGRFAPFQQPSTGLLNAKRKLEGHKGVRLLSNYIYVPIQRKMKSPYPIPPFLASVFTVEQHEQLISSMFGLAKRLGVGFLSVMLDPNAVQAPPSTSEARLNNNLVREKREGAIQTMITAAYNRIKEGLTNGMFVGVKNQHEIKVEGEMNADNADKLIEIFDRLLFSALKQDPNLMGQNHTVTETFGNVILKKFGEQLDNILQAKASVYKRLYELELLLAGFGECNIAIEFEAPELVDIKKVEEAKTIKQSRILALEKEGYISRQQGATELGYDEPYKSEEDVAQDAPIQEPIQSNSFSYPYDVPTTCCPSSRNKEDFAISDFKNKTMNKIAKRYINSLQKQYTIFVEATKKSIRKELKKEGIVVSQSRLQQLLIGTAIELFEKQFKDKIKATAKTNVFDAYSYFRKDKSIFKGFEFAVDSSEIEQYDVPNSVFEQIDYTVIRYLQESDTLYLGRFITDPDTINRFRLRVAELYVSYGAVDLGADSEALDELVEEFAAVLGLERWKIRRIAETTLNNARSYATLMYMNQLEITEYERVEIADNLICPHCLAINGKRFTVSKAVEKIQSIVGTSPETVPPFATTRDIAEFRTMTSEQLQDAGIGFGALHPHCRGQNLPIQSTTTQSQAAFEKYGIDYVVDGDVFSFSYAELKEHYTHFIEMTDDEFLSNIKPALHLACMICYVKEVPTSECLSDKGIIHQLSHLLDIPDEPLIDLAQIRNKFEKTLKLS